MPLDVHTDVSSGGHFVGLRVLKIVSIGVNYDGKINVEARTRLPHVDLRGKISHKGDLSATAQTTGLPVQVKASANRDNKGKTGYNASVSAAGVSLGAGKQNDGSLTANLGAKTPLGLGCKIEGNSKGERSLNASFESDGWSTGCGAKLKKDRTMVLSAGVSGREKHSAKTYGGTISCNSKGEVEIGGSVKQGDGQASVKIGFNKEHNKTTPSESGELQKQSLDKDCERDKLNEEEEEIKAGNLFKEDNKKTNSRAPQHVPEQMFEQERRTDDLDKGSAHSDFEGKVVIFGTFNGGTGLNIRFSKT